LLPSLTKALLTGAIKLDQVRSAPFIYLFMFSFPCSCDDLTTNPERATKSLNPEEFLEENIEEDGPSR